MVNFKDFNKTADTMMNIREAVTYCKEHGEKELLFPKDTYSVKSEYAFDKWLSVSNHGSGLKRIVFLLEDINDLTIDFSGSTIILEDVLIPFAIINCKNITIKNFKLRSLKPMAADGVITSVRDNGFSFKLTGISKAYVKNGALFGGEEKGDNDNLIWANEWRKEDGMLTEKYSDLWLGQFKFSDDGENNFTAEGGEKLTEKMGDGNAISFQQAHRVVCGVFVESSYNTKITDYTIYNGIGMGVIAQNSDTVSIDKMTVIPYEGACHSLNADATHFVHCKGLIKIENSHFEGQLDDALNVHGIYLRIEDIINDTVILKFMHHEAAGIDCVREGFLMESCDPESLIPKGRYKVTSVKKLNFNHLAVRFAEGTDGIKIGDDMTEVSYVCDVLFKDNTLYNNRARGMLLASAGKLRIEHNKFITPGAPIKFESDGAYWFESGGTRDVVIKNNEFINNLYVEGGWGSTGIIDVMRKAKTEEGKYFHGTIEISDNVFKNCKKPIASINNTEKLIMKNNELIDCENSEPVISYVKEIVK